MNAINLKLTFVIGLAFFIYNFNIENIGFFALFIIETIICEFFRKKNKSLFLFVFFDLLLFVFLNFIMDVLMSFLLYLPQETLNQIYYTFSLPYYDFCMIYRVIVVHMVAFSYLTFGKSPNVKKTLLSVLIIFLIQQLSANIFSIEQFLIFFATLGIANYLFYNYYKKKRQLSLSLNKEILFLLYFIGFSLSLFEHLPLIDIEYYSSTTYNYILFLLVTYYVLSASEIRLKRMIYKQSFKVILGVLVLFSFYFKEFTEYYLTQSSFLILTILVITHLNRKMSFKYQTNL